MSLFGCSELINIGGGFVAIARWIQEPCYQIGIWIWNKMELHQQFLFWFPTSGDYKYHEPTQKPIDPPYKIALANKRGAEAPETDEPEEEFKNENLETKMSDCTLWRKNKMIV